MKKNKVDLIFDRIMGRLKVGKVQEALNILDIKRGTYDSWRRAGKISNSRMYEIATKMDVDRNWLDGGDYIAVREPSLEYGGSSRDSIPLPYHPEIYASAGGGAYGMLSEVEPLAVSRAMLEGYLGVSGSSRGIHLLNVVGDSMEPTLYNGELIIVNPIENEPFRDGGIYVLLCQEVILVKRVRRHPITKTYTLLSDNPSIPPVELPAEDESCRLVGRAVGHLDRV